MKTSGWYSRIQISIAPKDQESLLHHKPEKGKLIIKFKEGKVERTQETVALISASTAWQILKTANCVAEKQSLGSPNFPAPAG